MEEANDRNEIAIARRIIDASKPPIKIIAREVSKYGSCGIFLVNSAIATLSSSVKIISVIANITMKDTKANSHLITFATTLIYPGIGNFIFLTVGRVAKRATIKGIKKKANSMCLMVKEVAIAVADARRTISIVDKIKSVA